MDDPVSDSCLSFVYLNHRLRVLALLSEDKKLLVWSDLGIAGCKYHTIYILTMWGAWSASVARPDDTHRLSTLRMVRSVRRHCHALMHALEKTFGCVAEIDLRYRCCVYSCNGFLLPVSCCPMERDWIVIWVPTHDQSRGKQSIARNTFLDDGFERNSDASSCSVSEEENLVLASCTACPCLSDWKQYAQLSEC